MSDIDRFNKIRKRAGLPPVQGEPDNAKRNGTSPARRARTIHRPDPAPAPIDTLIGAQRERAAIAKGTQERAEIEKIARRTAELVKQEQVRAWQRARRRIIEAQETRKDTTPEEPTPDATEVKKYDRQLRDARAHMEYLRKELENARAKDHNVLYYENAIAQQTRTIADIEEDRAELMGEAPAKDAPPESELPSVKELRLWPQSAARIVARRAMPEPSPRGSVESLSSSPRSA